MNPEGVMRPIEIAIIPVAENQLSVSIDYDDRSAAAVKTWRADREVVDALCDRLEDLLREADEMAFTDSERVEQRKETQERLTSVGLGLYQEIMKEEGDALRARWDAPEEERYLVFRIDRSLGYIPFELMNDGRGFLSQSVALGRIILTGQVENPAPPAGRGPLRVMIAGDPSDDPVIRADVEREIAAIRDVFSGKKDYSLRIASGREVDRGFLLTGLPGLALFHFTGHGVVGDKPKETGIKLPAGKILSPDTLRGIQNPPGLVFLNMCTAAPRAAWKGSLGLVETLLRRGVRGCVASLWDVRSEPATRLASSFYRYLTKGETFGHALRRARVETAKVAGIHDTTWAAYALYGDPRLTLGFEPPSRRGSRAPARILAAVIVAIFFLVFFLFPAAIQKERLGSGGGAHVGYVLVESQPADASISVDGEVITRTPVTIEMPAGRHHMVIEKQGYKRWEAWVEVKESARTDIRADLVEIR
jgi:CHAT domain-containing protein